MDVKIILKNHLGQKLSEHIPSAFSIPMLSSFKDIENKTDVHKGKDCTKIFCEFSREHTTEMINFLKNKIINKQNSRNHMKSQNIVILAKKKLKINMLKIKNIIKLKIIAIIEENTEAQDIAYAI